MTTYLSGVELYGGSKLLGVPFFPEFKKLLKPDSRLKFLWNQSNSFVSDGMYEKSDDIKNEQESESSEVSGLGLPLHRSPVVFAALCAMGEDESAEKKAAVGGFSDVAGVSRLNDQHTARVGNAAASNEEERTANQSKNLIKHFPERHARTRQRSTPYQLPKGSFSANFPPALPQGKDRSCTISHHTSWDGHRPMVDSVLPETTAIGSSNNISKSFSAPEKLDLRTNQGLESTEVSGDKVRTFAIKNLAMRCVAAQGSSSSVFSDTSLLPGDANQIRNLDSTVPQYTPMNSLTSLIQPTLHCGASCRVPSTGTRQSSYNFRRLYISSETALSPLDIDLQRHITKSLKTHGVCVIDRLMGEELGSGIADEVRQLHTGSSCVKGELLGGRKRGDAIRGDLITWVDGAEPECKNLGIFCRKLDKIVSCGSGVTSSYSICGGTKAMVARYPGNGTHYKLHVDNPAKDGRCLTFIYYINKGWDSKTMGGTLRLQAQTSGKTANISPIFDRVVIFYSDSRNPHEVLPTYDDRYAVTVWYFDHEERARALQRMDAYAKSSTSTTPKAKQ